MQLVEQYTLWVDDMRTALEKKNKTLEQKNLEIQKLSYENEKYTTVYEKSKPKKDG